MEFNEKLQLLRKEKGLTQEQLAEKLFVSRTAISKWENGRGFPNLDSLKNIATLYSISIDELLSGDELLTIAEKENKSNIANIYHFIFYCIDTLMVLVLFLPIFGMKDGNFVRSVSLLSFSSVSSLTRIFYILLILSTIFIGVAGIFSYLRNKEWRYMNKILSAAVFILAVIGFMLSQQPYPAFISFILLLFKITVIVKARE